jgi:hypothetical protein
VDDRVKAIRDDKKVGRGTCTTIDECYSDEELIAELNEEGVKTPADAVKWAHELEGLRIENALNHRWGEDSDPELERYKNWNS